MTILVGEPKRLKSAPQVWTNTEGSMAAETVRKRWPQTVKNMAEDIKQSAAELDIAAKKEEGFEIARAVEELKAEIQQNEQLKPLESDGSGDIELYNRQLAKIGPCSWQASPWLYAECYLYRRVQLLFSSSLHWKDYDVFKRAKDTAFRLSQAAVHELAARYRDVLCAVSQTAGSNDSRGHLLFEEMTLVALWGNATDLSLLTKLSLEDIQGLQGAEAIRRNMRNIVSNDEELTWQYLVGGQPHERVDIVLDNSGFEFVTDLIYGSYLLKSGFANHVVLHTKSFPWFVSDVTPRDVETTLRDMENPAIFPDRGALDYVVGMIRSHLKSGQMTVESHDFWTTACSFHELPAEAPDLYAYLQRSNLVVFKGDLNYRKLTNDALWPYTTPFKTALGPMGDGSGVKILALRTNKADVCVGLADEDMVKRLEEEAPGQAWTRNGKYAVISFSDGL